MRPSAFLLLALSCLIVADLSLIIVAADRHGRQKTMLEELHLLTDKLGLSDLCLSTEARYTRHPSVSDPLVPFMDHPAAIEHFPSGSFFRHNSQTASEEI